MGRTPDAIISLARVPFGKGTAPFMLAGSGVRGKTVRSMWNKAQTVRLCTRLCCLIAGARHGTAFLWCATMRGREGRLRGLASGCPAFLAAGPFERDALLR